MPSLMVFSLPIVLIGGTGGLLWPPRQGKVPSASDRWVLLFSFPGEGYARGRHWADSSAQQSPLGIPRPGSNRTSFYLVLPMPLNPALEGPSVGWDGSLVPCLCAETASQGLAYSQLLSRDWTGRRPAPQLTRDPRHLPDGDSLPCYLDGNWPPRGLFLSIHLTPW